MSKSNTYFLLIFVQFEYIVQYFYSPILPWKFEIESSALNVLLTEICSLSSIHKLFLQTQFSTGKQQHR